MSLNSKKIIVHIACGILSLLVALGAVAAIIHNLKLKTVYLSVNSTVSEMSIQSEPEIIEPEVSEPEYLEITEETASNINIDDVKEMVESIKPSEENIIKVNNTPIDASGLKSRQVKLPVKYLLQNPELPTGCEITALTTVLNYYEFDVSKTVMAADYLQKSTEFPANFWEVFLGDPTKSTGFGCYAQPITDAANKYFKEQNADFAAINRSGSKFESLLTEVENGKPVVIWGTLDMQEPYSTYEWVVNGKTLKWIRPEHCMVLIGYDIDRGKAIISDPQQGTVEYDLETVKARYIALHSQCVVIERIDTPPIIEGVSEDEIYYVSQKVTVTDENLATVTVNGISHPTEFIIDGNIDKTYKIIATDDAGNITETTIEMKAIDTIKAPIKNITELNVTSENKSDIENVQGIIASINTENATAKELLCLDELSSSCDMLNTVIANIGAEIKRINKELALYLIFGVSQKDEENIKQLVVDINALTSSQNITKAEREKLEAHLTKCDKYLAEIAK